SSTGGLNFGTLGSSTAAATTSAPSVGFGSGLFGSKSTTGFTLGGTSTGRKKTFIAEILINSEEIYHLYTETGLCIYVLLMSFTLQQRGGGIHYQRILHTEFLGLCGNRSVCWFAFSAGTTGFTLNLGGTTAPTTTASTGLSLGGALAGLGGSLFQNTSTAATGLGQNALGLTLGTTAAPSTTA
ncbi:NUP58 protein, partial [Syrrhaptes paradoxus]|nr:NUP58 protein [Syrrhaptes paradoxus]